MTDREIMLHRFCHKNIKKRISKLCKELGITEKEYEAACERAMKEETRNKK